MGSGKTSVGRTLARRVDRPFVDLDKLIVAEAGSSIAELFEQEGESAFRDRETAALEEVLARPDPVVLATGGGVVVRPDNVERLHAGATVIWLRAAPQTLAHRVGDGSGRPLLVGGHAEGTIVDRLRRLTDERRDAYEAAAHRVVDVDRRTRAQVVDEVLAPPG